MKHKILTLTSILLITAFTPQQLVWAYPAPIPPTQWDGSSGDRSKIRNGDRSEFSFENVPEMIHSSILRPRAAGERGRPNLGSHFHISRPDPKPISILRPRAFGEGERGNLEDGQAELIKSICSDKKFIQDSIAELHPDMTEVPMKTLIPVLRSSPLKPGKKAFETKVVFDNNEERTMLFMATSDPKVVDIYHKVTTAGSGRRIVYQMGAKTKVCLKKGMDEVVYYVMSLNFYPGISASHIYTCFNNLLREVSTLVKGSDEQIDSRRRQHPSIQENLKYLFNLNLIGEAEVERFLRAVQYYGKPSQEQRPVDTGKNISEFLEWIEALRVRLFVECFKARLYFHLVTGYYPYDREIVNVIVQVSPEGYWEYRVIDYESMRRVEAGEALFMSLSIEPKGWYPVMNEEAFLEGFCQAALEVYGPEVGYTGLKEAAMLLYEKKYTKRADYISDFIKARERAASSPRVQDVASQELMSSI